MEPGLDFRVFEETSASAHLAAEPVHIAVEGSRTSSGDDVKNAAVDNRRTRRLSRLIGRRLRSSAGLTGGSRLLALLSALAIFAGIQSAVHFERSGASRTELVTPLASPMSALHTAPTVRVVVAARSVSRLPDAVAAALPASPADGLRVALVACDVTLDAMQPPCGSVASRGYDATAPPALS